MPTRPFIRNLPSSDEYYQRKHMVIDNFSGGLNNVDNESVIGDNQMVDCQNMMFSDNFTVEKRYGLTCMHQGLEGDTALTWYDEYITTDGDKFVITASDTKFYVNDIFVCNVAGDVEGVTFNGEYYFVDGANLHKLERVGENSFIVYKIINDPKIYMDSFPINYTNAESEVVTLYEVFKDVSTPVVDYRINYGDYSSTYEYFADPYGKIPISHGDNAYEVNANNYTSYYRKVTTNVNKSGIKLYGFRYNNISPNVYEDDIFTLISNLLGSYTEYDVEAYDDEVTQKVKYTFSSKQEQYRYKIKTIDTDYNIVTFAPVTYDETTGTYTETTDKTSVTIYSDEFGSMWDEYLAITDTTEASDFLSSALQTNLAGSLCRCYEPRDNTWNNGELMIDSANNMWYQPCQNELDYAFLGECYLPTNPRNLCVCKGRLWTTGDYGYGNEVRCSNINQACYFPATTALGMNPNGDVVQDMFEFDGSLVVGRHKDIYAVYGNSADGDNPFRIQKVDATTGLMGANCGSLINNYYLFLGFDGRLYKMTTPTTNVEYLSVKPITTYVDLGKAPLNIAREDMNRLSSVALNNTVYWLIGDKIIVYSYTHMAFTYFTDWNASSLYTDGIDIYVGDKYGNRCKWTKGNYNDLGKPIKGVLKTKTYILGMPTVYKYFEQSLFTFDRPDGVDSNVTMTVYMDNRRRVLKQTFPIFTSNFDESEWDINRFSGLPYQKTVWWRLNFRSRSICFVFTNNELNETFRVIDFDTIYTLRDIR